MIEKLKELSNVSRDYYENNDPTKLLIYDKLNEVIDKLNEMNTPIVTSMWTSEDDSVNPRNYKDRI
jgi:hypothetical protein